MGVVAAAIPAKPEEGLWKSGPERLEVVGGVNPWARKLDGWNPPGGKGNNPLLPRDSRGWGRGMGVISPPLSLDTVSNGGEEGRQLEDGEEGKGMLDTASLVALPGRL